MDLFAGENGKLHEIKNGNGHEEGITNGCEHVGKLVPKDSECGQRGMLDWIDGWVTIDSPQTTSDRVFGVWKGRVTIQTDSNRTAVS